MTENTNFSRHQNLFNTLHNMGYILLESEMQEVVSAVEKDKMEAEEDFSGWTQVDEFEDTEDEILGYQCLGCGNIQDYQTGFGCDRCLGHCLEPWYG